MKATLSVLVNQLRGKAGNVVGKNSSAGQVIMIRSVGKDPRTTGQINARTKMQEIGAHWKGLTPQQRAGWNLNAENGRSGYDLYFERSMNLVSIGKPYLTYYKNPIAFTDTINLGILMDAKEGYFKILLDTTGLQDEDYLVLKISQFTARVLSLETYKFKNAAYTKIEGTQEWNVYDAIVKANGKVPEFGQLFYLKLEKVSGIAGNSEPFRLFLMEWEYKGNPTVPVAEVSINPAECHYDTKTLQAKIVGAFELIDYNYDFEGSSKAFLDIYENKTGSVRLKTVELYDNWNAELKVQINKVLNNPFDTSIYPAGATKYWVLRVDYYEALELTRYTYESERIPITAT